MSKRKASASIKGQQQQPQKKKQKQKLPPKFSKESSELGKHIVSRILEKKLPNCEFARLKDPLNMQSKAAGAIRRFIDHMLERQSMGAFVRMCIVPPGQSPVLPSSGRTKRALEQLTEDDFKLLWDRTKIVFSGGHVTMGTKCCIVMSMFVKGCILAEDYMPDRWHYGIDLYNPGLGLTCAELAAHASHRSQQGPSGHRPFYNSDRFMHLSNLSEWIKAENCTHLSVFCNLIEGGAMSWYFGEDPEQDLVDGFVSGRLDFFRILVVHRPDFAAAASVIAPLARFKVAIEKAGFGSPSSAKIISALEKGYSNQRQAHAQAVLDKAGLFPGPSGLVAEYCL